MKLTSLRAISSVSLMSIALAAQPVAIAQSARSAEFDAVSIKRHTSQDTGGSMRSLPDGTFMMTGFPLTSIIRNASPIRVREVIGFPDWVETERYDITAKPPSGSTRAQLEEMWRTMFADRMKLAGHVEEHERNGFALVLARSDGRLGPQIKSAPPECNPRPGSKISEELSSRCGGIFGQGVLRSAITTLDTLALQLSSLAGGQVENRTGLQGFYEVELKFSQPQLGDARDTAAAGDDAPGIFTAVQEQLGLKLQPVKLKLPIFVVDHIERPSEN
jgi:uncharacterized protein (TIGR03435 family)